MDKIFKIITLSGSKGSGKNTAADRLTTYHGFAEIAFADFLRKMSIDLLTAMECEVSNKHFLDREMKETFIYDVYGRQMLFNNRGKKGMPMTYRQFLQTFGTEAVRNNIHDEAWILPVRKFIRDKYMESIFNGVVVTDARFPNEINFIKDWLKAEFPPERIMLASVNVIRPAIVHNDRHASETSMGAFEFDFGLMNNGTIKDLYTKIDKVITREWQRDKILDTIQTAHDSSWLRKYDDK